MGRLFWKTLLGFLITYIAASFGVLPAFTLLRHQRSLNDLEIGDRLGPAAVELCRRIVVEMGPRHCEGSLAGLVKPQYAARLIVTRAGDPVSRSGGGAISTAMATAPDGNRYRVTYRTEPKLWPLPVPFEVILLGFVGSLAFSAVLVGYVVAPLRRIRSGFSQLAGGNLAARVGHRVGRRRDEIADLARDFDVMASRLEHLVASRDRLLHDVSHELRSPLSRLQMSIALARQNQMKLPSSLDRIECESQRLNAIVDELLALARAENGMRRTDEYFDLRDLLIAVVDDVDFEAQGKRVTIVRDIAPAITEQSYAAQGSSELIRRAIENVMRNAVKFSDPGESLSVALTWSLDAREAVIQVRDQGRGVSEDFLPRIFEPFVTSDLEQAGFGLGLSIAQRAVRAHEGRISASNLPEGGFSVTINLPLLRDSSGVEFGG